MESIGKYWIPIFNILEDQCEVTLANPKFVRSIPRKKQILKIPSGLQICINPDWSQVVLFLLFTINEISSSF